MGLIGNYTALHKTPGNFIGGSSTAPNTSILRANYDKPGSLRSSEFHFGNSYAIPQGYSAPYAYLMPRNYNFISSYTSSNGLIDDNALMAGGRNLEAPISANIVLVNAQLDQIVTFIGSSLMTFTTVNAQLDASVNIQASAILQLTSNASVGAIIDVLASANIAITPNVLLTALGHMNAEAGGPTALSPEALAEAVWSAVLTDYVGDGMAGLIVQEIKANLKKKLDVGTFIALK